MLPNRSKILIAVLLAFGFYFTSVNVLAHNENAVATVTQIKKSIIAIGTSQLRRVPPHLLLGTGFVVRDGNHVITNAHVVDKPIDRVKKEKWMVFVGRGKQLEFRQAEIVKVLPKYDLALLKFDGEALPPATIGDSSEVREGRVFYFTGYPLGAIFGLYPATHHALLASVAPLIIPVNNSQQLNTRTINLLRKPYNIFQLDGIAYPGGSGSPLYDPETGNVFGVINMTLLKSTKERALSDPSGIVYAIPSEYITALFR